jgi:hypothetical protein
VSLLSFALDLDNQPSVFGIIESSLGASRKPHLHG